MKRALFLPIAILLAAAIALFSAVALTACGPKGGSESSSYGTYVSGGNADISIGILADIHVFAEEQAVDFTSNDFKTFESKGQKMLGLSESVFKTAVDRIIKESDLKVVLLSGDQADDGGFLTHRAIARELKRLEDAGIQVFVIPGNHDINNISYTYAGGKQALADPTSEAEFAEIYEDFGYSPSDVLEFYKNAGEANKNRAEFSNGDNLSYVADLPGNYRLIAIDMVNHVSTGALTDGSGAFSAMGADVNDGVVTYDNKPYPTVSGRHNGAMTESLLLWAKEKTEEALAEGKIPLGMMHFPLVKHFGQVVTSKNMLTNDPVGYSVAETLADAGMKYIFTGHIHIQDNAMFVSKAGNKILDINTGTLANYPTPIRVFQAKGNDVRIRTWNMDRVSEDYLPASLSEKEKTAILSDFRKYSLDYIDDSMIGKVRNKVDLDMMYKILGVFGVKKGGENDAEVDALAQKMFDELFLGFVKTPLYKKDASNGGGSVEAIAERYGVKLPASNYTTVFNVAMSYAAALYEGDEHLSLDEPRYLLLKYSIFAFFDALSKFDLFGKMREISPSVKEIDLSSALPELFLHGNLKVCDNNILVGVVSSLDIAIVKQYLKFDEKTDPYEALSSVKKIIRTLDLKDKLFGIELGDYITANATQKVGFIKLGALMDDCFSGPVLVSLANDSLEEMPSLEHKGGRIDLVPSDRELIVNTETMEYSSAQ